MTSRFPRAAGFAIALATLATSVHADWPNIGGNSQRNATTSAIGPTSIDLKWSNTLRFSIIAWHPLVADGVVVAIRETGFPSATASNDRLVAWDLASGTELWAVEVPYGGDNSLEWIAWCAGISNGQVYASRSGSGRITPVYAYDLMTGAPLWTSASTNVAGPYGGVVFAPDGDLILGDFDSIARIDWVDGSTVWEVPRVCSVSGTCGVAATDDAIYYHRSQASATTTGIAILKLDIATGATLYESPIMPGFTAQNTPLVGPDGAVYFSRSQNNPPVDNLFRFTDTGTGFTLDWSVPVRWTTSHTIGVSDAGVYTFNAANEFVRLDPLTGAETANAGVLFPQQPLTPTSNLSAYTAIDAAGTVYISNGWGSSPANLGELVALPGDLSSEYFRISLDRQNNGGPAIASDGTLILADRTGLYAYAAGNAACSPADLSSPASPGSPDGVLTGADFFEFLVRFQAGDLSVDFSSPASPGTPDGVLSGADFFEFLNLFAAGC